MNAQNKILVISSDEFLVKISDQLNSIIELIASQANIPKQESTELLLSVDVQKYLKVSSSTLQSYRTTGKIDFIKVGRKIYYTNEHIKNFINDNL